MPGSSERELTANVDIVLSRSGAARNHASNKNLGMPKPNYIEFRY
jgi:hypothetical protein